MSETNDRAELIADLREGADYLVGAYGHEVFATTIREAADILESQAVAGSIRVDIEGVGICDIPVRDGVAYMPEITVADIVRRAQPAPVDAAVERDARTNFEAWLTSQSSESDADLLLKINDGSYVSEVTASLFASWNAALAAQQQGSKSCGN